MSTHEHQAAGKVGERETEGTLGHWRVSGLLSMSTPAELFNYLLNILLIVDLAFVHRPEVEALAGNRARRSGHSKWLDADWTAWEAYNQVYEMTMDNRGK